MMYRALFAVFVVSSSLTACDPDNGIPAEELCAAIEARSDCASNECITVGCYDGPPTGRTLPSPHCQLVHDTYASASTSFVYVTGDVEAVSETAGDCNGDGYFATSECAPADTGAVPADVLVACLETDPPRL